MSHHTYHQQGVSTAPGAGHHAVNGGPNPNQFGEHGNNSTSSIASSIRAGGAVSIRDEDIDF